jgi:hypothetical protein
MSLEDQLLPSSKEECKEEAKNGVGQTACLIVANLAGAGILSLPKVEPVCVLVLGPVPPPVRANNTALTHRCRLSRGCRRSMGQVYTLASD